MSQTMFADPGYLGDKRPRIPLCTPDQVRAAWGRLSDGPGLYTLGQHANIRHRILAAAIEVGIDVIAEDRARLQRLQAYYFLPTPRTEELLDEAAAKVTEANDSMIQVEEPTDQHTGVMVAFMLAPDQAEQLAVDGGEPADELHLTLCYLGEIADVAPDLDTLERLRSTVAGFAHTSAPVDGEVSGAGVFTASDTPVTYASADVPALPALRQRLVDTLTAAGFPPNANHGYTPHITLAYDNLLAGGHAVDTVPLRFDTITLAAGGARFGYLMDAPTDGDDEEMADAEAAADQLDPDVVAESEIVNLNKDLPQAKVSHPFKPAHTDENMCLICGGPIPEGGQCNAGVVADTTTASDVTTTSRFLISDVLPRLDIDVPVTTTKAFVTELGPRTILTGPASVLNDSFERAMTPNQHFSWMAGRFVGADEPNRNGAYWAADDLEMGQGTVRYGPLNWLHEGRHVIGAIADAQFVRPADTQTSDDNAAGVMRPHIAALSVIWRFLYPDEASVIDMASDSGRLWYSMECVSEQVRCLGCDAQAGYLDYLKGIGGACEHMIARSAPRHFVNPTFLGGAVIVPPVRPGWADADARLMAQAASLAERAYEQAGRPDMPASEWELLMTQVVSLATVS